MPEVVREGCSPAGAQEIWDVVAAVHSMAQWYPAARRAEKLSGPDEGVGRVQRVRYKSGGRNGAVDTEVVGWEPQRRLVLRQVREFLGSKQSPLLARNVTTTIEIECRDEGDAPAVIRVISAWEPVGLKGQLATDTVLVPRACSLAQGVVDRIVALVEPPVSDDSAAADGPRVLPDGYDGV